MSGKLLTSGESIHLPGWGRNDYLARTIARLYLESAPALLEAMRDAADRGNMRQLCRAAQSLASSSANLGALRLAGLCRQIAELPSKAALQSAPALLQEIDAATAAVCAKLTEFIKTSAAELSAQ